MRDSKWTLPLWGCVNTVVEKDEYPGLYRHPKALWMTRCDKNDQTFINVSYLFKLAILIFFYFPM